MPAPCNECNAPLTADAASSLPGMCKQCARPAHLVSIPLDIMAQIPDAAFDRSESAIRVVIRDRLADWTRRSDKWHGVLDRARAWVAFGDKAPTIIAAAAALAAWQYPAHAALFPLVGALLSAIVGWRQRSARSALDDSHTEQVWLIADRMAEYYRGLVARFGIDPDVDLLRESQRVESTARIGLPPEVKDSISRVLA